MYKTQFKSPCMLYIVSVVDVTIISFRSLDLSFDPETKGASTINQFIIQALGNAQTNSYRNFLLNCVAAQHIAVLGRPITHAHS